MMTTTDHAAIAAEINSAHSLAMSHANIAIDHAKRAGELLLQVKNALPHGDFLPWIAANIAVSERQAQRYIRAALGKPLPVRALANTTHVSDLCWLPKSPNMVLINFADGGSLHVQESADHRGFYFALYLTGDIETGGDANFTIKPIRADFVERVIFDLLPGKHTRDCSIAKLPWAYIETHDGDAVREYLEILLPKGYEHLRRNNQQIETEGLQ